MTITIPLPQKLSSNAMHARMHWTKRAKISDEFYQAVWFAVKEQKVKRITKYPVDCRYDFVLEGKLLDTLNTAEMAKLVEDGLRKAGVLDDDGQKHVREVTLAVHRAPKVKKGATMYGFKVVGSSWVEVTVKSIGK